MKLDEISALSKGSIISFMVIKLLNSDIKVHMKSIDTVGGVVRGLVTGASPNPNGLTIRYIVRHSNSTYATYSDSTLVSNGELEDAKLIKQKDGSYLFDFPNEEFEGDRRGPTRAPRKEKQ